MSRHPDRQPVVCPTCGREATGDQSAAAIIAAPTPDTMWNETRLRALESVAEAARFHNKTPNGATRACLDGCIACEALANLDATREEMK